MADSHQLMASPVARSGQSDDWYDVNQYPADELSAVTLSHENRSNSCTSPATRMSSSCAVVLIRDHPASRPMDHHTSLTCELLFPPHPLIQS
jgi:putative hemolysin